MIQGIHGGLEGLEVNVHGKEARKAYGDMSVTQPGTALGMSHKMVGYTCSGVSFHFTL